ncbi:MAG: DUF1800 domain-containing protein [Pyrinomonadaceae bacterium]
MKGKRFNLNYWQLYRKYLGICLTVFLLSGAGAVFAAATPGEEDFESSAPILISEANSTRALATNPGTWSGELPLENSEIFLPGSRVVVFVTNVDLLPDEGASAFRVFAQDKNGKQFRLAVENIQRLRKQDWIYGLTLRVYDENGYNGQPDGGVLLRVSWRGNTSNSVRLDSRKNSKVRDYPGAIPTPAPLKRPARVEMKSAGVEMKSAGVQSTPGDRKRFMEQAAFGPSRGLDFRLRQIGMRRWIEEQFYEPYPTIPYPNFPQKPFDADVGCGTYGTSPEVNLCHRNHYWAYNNKKWLFQEALYGDDQLRRRVSWALHQIWVVSSVTVSQQRWMQEYIEILDRNAFGNYRDLMREMTLSPAMGEYLDMIRSTRTDPNENYPREILQLFTIGLNMLNQDGTPILDNQGNRIPTYDQGKIDQFTKVFTGWTRCDNGTNPACPNAVVGAPNFIDPIHLSFPNNHDQTAKSLFDYPGAPNPSIPACGNCTNDAARIAYANDSLNKTLDNIFHHPNVAPFVGKLLIQHLVTSDPSPAYVARVAAAFNNNGAGVRGDMKAVIKAVLLDPEARGSRKTDPTYGKFREPFQYLTNFLRTFGARASTPIMINGVLTSPPSSCQNKSDGVMDWDTYQMGQDILLPATVFNYFPPDYVVPGTDILGPEFAIANTSTSFVRNNFMMGISFGWGWFNHVTAADPYPGRPCGTSIDHSEAVDWATKDPTGNSLIEGLNTKMMHGTMSEAMKSKIRTAINFNVSAQLKAYQAIYLIGSSSQYQIQK